MTTPSTIRIRATVLATLIATACGTAGTGTDRSAPQPADRSMADIEALYRARTDSARMDFTEADVRFMTGMIGHHAQALVMTALAPSHGASQAVLTLTSRQANAQGDEIATMQRWLRDRGLPVPTIEIEGIRLTIDGPAYAMHMPGMLSQEQLENLDRARGTEFDRLFLKYMIQHHRGAVEMVHELFATDGAAQDGLAFKLASDIQVDQKTEIARMELMLSEMSDRSGSP